MKLFSKLKIFLLSILILSVTGCAELEQLTQKTKAFINKNILNKQENISMKKIHSDKPVLLIILDGSGSMADKDYSGKIKIDAARESLKDILNKIDTKKVNVSLMAFNKGCNSTELLVPPTGNTKEVLQKAQDLIPNNATPLAYSLQQAGEFIKKIDKPVKIILITDGMETCGGNPEKIAKELKQKYGVDVQLFVIGYGVDEYTKRSLQKVAKAANGEYFDAKNSSNLNEYINKITKKLKIVSKNWNGDTYKFNINFDSGSAKIKPKYIPQIKKLAEYLKNTGYGAELQGHTDSVGDAKYNEKLSLKRAQAVVNKLIEFGVDKDKVYAVGYGEYAPIASNSNARGRYLNRRVEAHIIKNGELNIAHLNKINLEKNTNIKQASKFSFIGYYKVTDPKRTFKNYHTYFVMYANNKGKYTEYVNGKKNTNNESFAWSYDKNKQTLTFDFTDKGKYPTNAVFKGKLKGNINDFYASGHWSNGIPGTVRIQRVSKEEYDCGVNYGTYSNGKCLY